VVTRTQILRVRARNAGQNTQKCLKARSHIPSPRNQPRTTFKSRFSAFLHHPFPHVPHLGHLSLLVQDWSCQGLRSMPLSLPSTGLLLKRYPDLPQVLLSMPQGILGSEGSCAGAVMGEERSASCLIGSLALHAMVLEEPLVRRIGNSGFKRSSVMWSMYLRCKLL